MKNSYSNIFSFNKKILKKTIKSLNNDVVGLPTETVYGLGGNAYSKIAIQKIFRLKGRPKYSPLIIHYFSLAEIYNDVIINENFKKYSPGKVIISFLVRYAISEELKNFDFGLGDEKYKKYWSNKTDKLNRYLDYKTFKGWLVYLLIKSYFKFRLVLKQLRNS